MAKKTTFSQKGGVCTLHPVSQLETLYKVSQILAAGTRQQEALTTVLDTLDKDIGLAGGTITILSLDGNEIRIEAAHDLLQKQSRTITYRIGEGVTGRVMQTGKPMIIPKVSKDPCQP